MVNVIEKPCDSKDPSVNEKQCDEKELHPGPCYGVRHTQVLLLFLLVCFGYCMRVDLSVGIVAMTDNSTNPDFPTYDWDDQSIILSSFFWGYVIPQIGAGQLAKRFGPKWLLVVAMSMTSLFTLLVPPMAEIGSHGVIICRVIQGFSQGFFYPCVHNLLSKWVPLAERTRLGTFVYAGGPFGTVIAMPVTGWISGSSLGWPFVFYMFGTIGFMWVLAYIVLGSNSIFDHKNISSDEKEYIKTSIGHDEDEDHSAVKTPWKEIFHSLPVWSILIAHCGQNWGFWTLLTEIPTYMSKILEYDIKANGLLSALPYFVLWLLSFVFGALSDLMINRKMLSIGAARKITTTIGMIGPAIALIGLGLAGGTNSTTAIALLVVAVGINSATYCGYQVNHIDLAPQHAGTLMGITNGIANIFSIIAPLSVQYIVPDTTDASQWNVIFYLAGGIYIVCSLFYIKFGSGVTQSWDVDKNKKEISIVIAENPTKVSAMSKEMEAYRKSLQK